LMLDRFRGRIMFPIHNHLGKVVGFTGRILPQLDTGNLGKYINSPETPIFQKSKLIYGFWKSKEGIREKKTAFLVEGQMDFLMSWQSGVKNVIASSGTAFTAEHLRALHRLAEEIVLSFDNDVAGSDAAARAIDLAEANDFSVKIATFKDVKDAADAAQKDPASIQRAIDEAIPAPEFYFKKYLPAARADIQTREGLQKLRVVLVKLKHMASPVERAHWMKELSRRTDIPERTLEEEAAKADTSFGAQQQPAQRTINNGENTDDAPKRQISRQERLCEALLAYAIASNDFTIMDDCLDYITPVQKELFMLLKSGKRDSDDATLDSMINFIVLQTPAEPSAEEGANLKNELLKEYYKERRHVLTLAVKNAEAKGNDGELAAALKELNELSTLNLE